GVTSGNTAVSIDGANDTASLDVGDNDTATISFAASTSSVAETTPTHAVGVTLTINADGTGPDQLAQDVSVNVAGLLTGTATPGAAGSGAGNLTYVVTVANVGLTAASGVTLSEVLTLPAGVSIVSVTPGGTTSYAPANSANGTWTVGNLGVGATATLTVVLTV